LHGGAAEQRRPPGTDALLPPTDRLRGPPRGPRRLARPDRGRPHGRRAHRRRPLRPPPGLAGSLTPDPVGRKGGGTPGHRGGGTPVRSSAATSAVPSTTPIVRAR